MLSLTPERPRGLVAVIQQLAAARRASSGLQDGPQLFIDAS